MHRSALTLSLLLACAAEAPKPEPKQAEPVKPAEPAKAEPVKATEPAKPAPDAKEACAKLVVVAWKGAEGSEATVVRDETAAKTEAAAIRAELAAGKDFAEVAARSDEPKTRAKGGAMGTYEREKWPEKYESIADAVFGLQVGETSMVFRLAHGYAVVQRCAIDKVHTAHILVRYKGAKNAEKSEKPIKRDKAAAQKLAAKIHAEATAAGADFAALAKKYSEDGSAEKGGDVGTVGRGMFAPAYETAAWALKPGETSAVVETDFGFHVIQRVD